MRLERIRRARTIKNGSLLALGALIVAPLLVSPQTVQADPILDALPKANQERYSDRGRGDRNNRRDDNRRDDNRRGDDRRSHDRDRDNNRGGWGNWGNRRDNDRHDNDRNRWERERQERERRERYERERRERERRERERDRWNNNRPGGWDRRNNGNWNNNGYWNWGGNSNRDSYVITGTVEDSRNQQNTLWVRGDNGQTYSIRTYQAERYRVGDRVRISGNRNSDNPQITRISGGYGYGGR